MQIDAITNRAFVRLSDGISRQVEPVETATVPTFAPRLERYVEIQYTRLHDPKWPTRSLNELSRQRLEEVLGSFSEVQENDLSSRSCVLGYFGQDLEVALFEAVASGAFCIVSVGFTSAWDPGAYRLTPLGQSSIDSIIFAALDDSPSEEHFVDVLQRHILGVARRQIENEVDELLNFVMHESLSTASGSSVSSSSDSTLDALIHARNRYLQHSRIERAIGGKEADTNQLLHEALEQIDQTLANYANVRSLQLAREVRIQAEAVNHAEQSSRLARRRLEILVATLAPPALWFSFLGMNVIPSQIAGTDTASWQALSFATAIGIIGLLPGLIAGKIRKNKR